jgi:hypothetical protein
VLVRPGKPERSLCSPAASWAMAAPYHEGDPGGIEVPGQEWPPSMRRAQRPGARGPTRVQAALRRADRAGPQELGVASGGTSPTADRSRATVSAGMVSAGTVSASTASRLSSQAAAVVPTERSTTRSDLVPRYAARPGITRLPGDRRKFFHGLSAGSEKPAERGLKVHIREREPPGFKRDGFNFGAGEKERVGQFRPQ